MHQLERSARAAWAAAIIAAAVAAVPSHLAAQKPALTKTQRDSAAKADSIKHAGHDMPGMKMPAAAPASKSPRPAAEPQKKTTTKPAAKSSPSPSTTSAPAKGIGTTPDRQVPVTKDMPMSMPGKDSTAM